MQRHQSIRQNRLRATYIETVQRRLRPASALGQEQGFHPLFFLKLSLLDMKNSIHAKQGTTVPKIVQFE